MRAPLIAAAFLLGTVPTGTKTVPVGTVPNGTALALSAISDDGLRADVKFLASDLLEGRAPSTRGGQLAAEFIASRFAGAGLKPAGEKDSYFQPVTIVEAKVDPTATLTISGGAGAPASLKYSTDFVAFSGLEQADVNADAEVIFVGYGINAPEQKWNDYAGVDVNGKIVLMMVNDPPAPADEPTLFGGPALTYYGRWTYKYEEAARQGAAGAILIHTTESASYPVASRTNGVDRNAILAACGAGSAGTAVEDVGDRRCREDAARTGGKGSRAASHGSRGARVQGSPARHSGRGAAASDSGQKAVAKRRWRIARRASRPGRRLHRTLRSLWHPRSEAR